MINLPPDKLKEILIKQGFINSETFDSLETEAKRKRQNLTDVLVSQGIVNKEYLYLLFAKSLGVERVNLGTVKIDESILHSLSEDTAMRRRVIVFGKEPDGTFQVAMEDPTDLETIDFLQLRLGGPIKPYLATDEDLNRGFSLYEAKLTKDFKKIIEESIKESLRSKAKGDLEEAAADLPVVAIVDNLLA